MPSSNSAALGTIEAAFHRFKATVSSNDARQFQHTELKDVWNAAREIEKQLAAKGEHKALRRIEPFLKGLGHYSETVGVLCNGTPYLPWIWAPIKLFLKIASDYSAAFEKLIRAYREIADALPRFDKLNIALRDHADFQAVLAVFYCDILDFHRRAYKFFRANAWKRFFDSSWGRFGLRFRAVLDSLKYHSELVDKEASAHSIASIQEWRVAHLEHVRSQEKDRIEDHFEKVLTWLDFRDYRQEDDVDNLIEKCYEDSSEWLFKHAKIMSWKRNSGQQSLLWLNGIPGSGKSVLGAQLIRHLQAEKDCAVAYFVCNFRSSGLNSCSNVLRAMVCQLIKQNQDLVGYIYDENVVKGVAPSKNNLKRMLPVLLSGIPSTKVVVDGLDECPDEEQAEILATLTSLVEKLSTKIDCKVTILSRDIPSLRKSLRKYSTISLKDEVFAVEASIKAFVNHKVQEMRKDIDDTFVGEEVFNRIEQKIVAKADGMFLWVRLMLVTLRDLHSACELEAAVESLPSGLEEAYGRILQRISCDVPRGSLEKARRVFSWIAYADRPLKTHELLDGVALCSPPYKLQENTKLGAQQLDRCKPLIEIDSFGYVSFVHFTVKEYILDRASGPFLEVERGLYNVALACVCSTMSDLDLVDPEIEEPQRIRNIVMGLHGLQQYAGAKWLHHLEQLSVACGGLSQVPEPGLAKYVEMLCARHNRLLTAKVQAGQVPVGNKALHYRLQAFRDSEPLRNIAEQVWQFEREVSDLTQTHAEDDSSGERHEQTLFGELSKEHSLALQRLLAADSGRRFPYVPVHHLTWFKAVYAGVAFPCRFAVCPQKSIGFASEQERDVHERTHSMKRFLCPTPTCPWASTRGFRIAGQLKKHMQTHHDPHRLPIPDFRSPRGMTSPTHKAEAREYGIRRHLSVDDEYVRSFDEAVRGKAVQCEEVSESQSMAALPQSLNTPQPNGQKRAPSSTPQTRYNVEGGVDTDHWPHPDETPPPPPPWLNEAIGTLRARHPGSDFEPLMRPYIVNISTGQTEKMKLESDQAVPPGIKLQWIPRIRCSDCVGKLYTAQRGQVVGDFEVHLRNRFHRERVQSRQNGQAMIRERNLAEDETTGAYFQSSPVLPPKRHSENLSPHRNLWTEGLETAHRARSGPEQSAITRERSPFRNGSPLAPVGDWRSTNALDGYFQELRDPASLHGRPQLQEIDTLAALRQQQEIHGEQAEIARQREVMKTNSLQDASEYESTARQIDPDEWEPRTPPGLPSTVQRPAATSPKPDSNPNDSQRSTNSGEATFSSLHETDTHNRNCALDDYMYRRQRMMADNQKRISMIRQEQDTYSPAASNPNYANGGTNPSNPSSDTGSPGRNTQLLHTHAIAPPSLTIGTQVSQKSTDSSPTPISALSSRFMSDTRLPSPSTFYPEWNSGNLEQINGLWPPRDFDTPVGSNGQERASDYNAAHSNQSRFSSDSAGLPVSSQRNAPFTIATSVAANFPRFPGFQHSMGTFDLEESLYPQLPDDPSLPLAYS